jgi:hypothetical protein
MGVGFACREARIFPVIEGRIKGTMRHPFAWNDRKT